MCYVFIKSWSSQVLSTFDLKYNIVTEYDCGLSIKTQTPESVADAIIAMASNKDNYDKYSNNAREGAKNFDFDVLSEKLIKIIDKTL